MQTMDSEIKDEVFVDEYTGGLVGPSLGFAATIKDGGHIRLCCSSWLLGTDDHTRVSWWA